MFNNLNLRKQLLINQFKNIHNYDFIADIIDKEIQEVVGENYFYEYFQPRLKKAIRSVFCDVIHSDWFINDLIKNQRYTKLELLELIHKSTQKDGLFNKFDDILKYNEYFKGINLDNLDVDSLYVLEYDSKNNRYLTYKEIVDNEFARIIHLHQNKFKKIVLDELQSYKDEEIRQAEQQKEIDEENDGYEI